MKMTKLLLLLFSIVLIQTEMFAQISNAGFEEWEQIQNYEKPMFWDTNQDSTFTRFEKGEISVEGEYSLKIIPSTPIMSCMSIARIGVKLQTPIGENKSLTFFAKSIPFPSNDEETVFLQVSGHLYSGGNFESNYVWETFDRIDDFTKIQIPITYPNVDSISIVIAGGASLRPADGCENYSYSWIDGMKIEELEVVSSHSELEVNDTEIAIFPNPSNGIIEINDKGNTIFNNNVNNNVNRFYLYSLDGRLVKSGHLTDGTINTQNILAGNYLIKLTNDDQSFEITKKVVIE